jgi:hypothetical protein
MRYRIDNLFKTLMNKGPTAKVGKQIDELIAFYNSHNAANSQWGLTDERLKELRNNYRQLRSNALRNEEFMSSDDIDKHGNMTKMSQRDDERDKPDGSFRDISPEMLDEIEKYLTPQCGKNELCLPEPQNLHIGEGPSCYVTGKLSNKYKGTMRCWKSSWDTYIISSSFIRIATKIKVVPFETLIMEFKNDYRKYMEKDPTDVPPNNNFRKELMIVLCNHYFDQVVTVLQTITDDSLAWLYEPTFLASLVKTVVREQRYFDAKDLLGFLRERHSDDVLYMIPFYLYFVEYLYRTHEKNNRFETIYKNKVDKFLNEFDDTASRKKISDMLGLFKRNPEPSNNQ